MREVCLTIRGVGMRVKMEGEDDMSPELIEKCMEYVGRVNNVDL